MTRFFSKHIRALAHTGRLLLLAWCVAAVMRIAVGGATVAMIAFSIFGCTVPDQSTSPATQAASA